MDGGTVGVWVGDGVVGGAVGVRVWVGVTTCAGVAVTFTVVVLLELHPAIAAAATAPAAIPQVIFGSIRTSLISCPVTLRRITHTG